MTYIDDVLLWLRQKITIPEVAINWYLRRFNSLSLRRELWLRKNPLRGVEEKSSYPSQYPVRLGILKEFWDSHWPYIAACRDLGVAYQVVDITSPAWISLIEKNGCSAYLSWPSDHMAPWKQLYEERLYLMQTKMGKLIYPAYDEIWFYESKRKMHYWLAANKVPHPHTWVFYDRDRALEFADSTALPIVFKSDLGSCATGVKIFRSRVGLVRFIEKCFARGFIKPKGYPLDRQWSNLLFQEYVADAREWRVIRVGQSFFAYEKMKKGDFASGSHCWAYSRPRTDLLDFALKVTATGGFRSMDLDIFETPDGAYLVNELQTVFGMGTPYEMCVVDNKPGRMVLDSETGAWRFEAGSYCQNHLCNQRILDVLDIIDGKVSLPYQTGQHVADSYGR